MQTSVTSVLDDLKVPYQLKEHSNPALTADLAAAERHVRLSQIVKCMVGTTGTELVVMLIPGDRKLKSSKARKYLKAAKLDLVDPTALSEEMGLTVGAIAPVQLIGKARMLMDPSVLDEERVDISSGDPMAGVELSSATLREILQAELIPMISQNP
jgi:prolyl-tRNA editing enzyme YbaK/EbsC (Cys-tRNA(Pro) deacylase)